MAKYILKDYASVSYTRDGPDSEPNAYVFTNKDQVIQKLLDWCNAESPVTYEVIK
tara:strand:+ start:2990 stop:3154 length:165 start_codon:yes stop_codon:yes gene_type:complete